MVATVTLKLVVEMSEEDFAMYSKEDMEPDLYEALVTAESSILTIERTEEATPTTRWGA